MPSKPTSTVTEAQRLRDYLLHKGGVDQTKLIDALKPFEDSLQAAPDDYSKIAQDDYSKLFIAFQTVKERCGGVVDDLTISEVLSGNSPYHSQQSVIASAGVTVVGVILVGLAIYFTNWSQRATYLLAEAEQFESFDHFGRMTRLIELAEVIDAEAIDYDGSPQPEELLTAKNHHDLAPQETVFLEGIQELRRHYQRETGLFTSMASHIERVSPVTAYRATAQRKLCPPAYYDKKEDSQPSLSIWQSFLGCIPPRPLVMPSQGSSGNASASSGDGNALEPSDLLPAFKTLNRYQGMQREAMKYAKRQQLDDYSAALQQVRSWTEELESSLAMVSRLFLPILYGALGSIVYCMWRLLNPATSPLGFWYTLLRTAFAGLAALTLSALIVPSNALAVGTEVTRPFVYMLSFIFGYSIEAFVNTLNALNRVLVSSIAPREKK